ncbi:peptide chain release factor N(5)-glutamine methyltransferase [Magnetospirillum sp. SS-4]|uniref:peptide chain release factor N(5)-glutamine methyltransferase n=1 Tax=Magnetospirillum sp. SS-4 TaxID=2681465 RepID=UPI00137D030D|nr:peptide chain release factor N(5)-glutamine methyltransferase [Magnetospirillum sp. SS-4]CAA7612942.1 Release factor glutamine methyltransferase [Magnetospirillum sp. SS-4]
MLTVAQLLHAAAGRLAAAGIETSRLDARLLLAEALGMQPQRLSMHPQLEPSAAEAGRFEALLERRLSRRPMSQVLGRRGFWTLELAVSADTLTPRPDTETVVEAVLAALAGDRGRPRRVLDLGTGTGCILLALLSELGFASGLGIDRSDAALAVARRNAEALGLAGRAAFQSGDWGRGLAGVFDVIVSNPPYIPDAEIDGLEPEVARFEPRLALAGGADGLDCYRALAPDIARLLAPGGVAALEVGAGQAGDVAALLGAAGLEQREIRRDLGGIDRCVVVSL